MNRKTIIDNKIKLIKDKFNNKDRTDEEKDKFNSFMSTVKKDYNNNNFDQVNETLEQVKQEILEKTIQIKFLPCGTGETMTEWGVFEGITFYTSSLNIYPFATGPALTGSASALVSSNQNANSTNSRLTMFAKTDGNLTFKKQCSSEINWDYLVIQVSPNTTVQQFTATRTNSGTNALYYFRESGSLGQSTTTLNLTDYSTYDSVRIDLCYFKDSSAFSFSDSVYFNDFELTATLDTPLIGSCPLSIENFSANLISTTTVDFSWDTCDSTLLEFELAQVDVRGNPNDANANITPYTAVSPTSSHSFQLTVSKLSGDYYVRNVCGSGNASIWIGPITLGTINENWVSPTIDTNVWENGANGSTPWRILSGATGSGTTGPSDDVTGGGYYIYTESSGNINTPHILRTATLVSVQNSSLIFSYHMYGATMGTLAVNINGEEKWTLTGDQGDVWNTGAIDISSYVVGSTITIDFIGTTGTSYTSDMALDNIYICEGGFGCTDPNSCNYNPNAGCDDGSCEYTSCAGCTNPIACNYDQTATLEDGSCEIPRCGNLFATNYSDTRCPDDGLCTYNITFNVDTKGIDVGPNGMYIGGGTVGGARSVQLTDTGIDNVWTGVWFTPPASEWFYGDGGNLNYTALNSPNTDEDFDTKEDIAGQICADGIFFNDRILDKTSIEAGNLVIDIAFGECDNHVSVWDIIKKSPVHTTLKQLIEDNNLVSTLDDKTGPSYTVFAPTDSAIDNMVYDGDIYTLLAHHVISGSVPSSDLINNSIITPLSGGSLIVKTEPTVMIDQATVTTANILADNGYVHVIDSVLIPVFGCMNKRSCNYNGNADIDDGSCDVAVPECGCDDNCGILSNNPVVDKLVVTGVLAGAAAFFLGKK